MTTRATSITPLAFSLAAPLLLCSSGAQAGPVQEPAQLLLDPQDACHMGLRHISGMGGLLVSDDGGRTFRLRCSATFDEAGEFNDDAFVAGFGADGAALVGSFAGLAAGDAQACGFGRIEDPLVESRVTDFARHPSDATLSYLAVSSASSGERTGIVARGADGSLSPVGASDTGASGSSDFFANRLHVVERAESEGGVRFYESGLLRKADDSLVPAVRYSDDGAQSWNEHEISEASDAAGVLLWAVDPTDPERILLSYRDASGSGTPDRVVVSSDGGATREDWIDEAVSEVSSVAVHADGRVWLGDQGGETPSSPRGLWTATSLADTPSKLGEDTVRCLGVRSQDGALFGCVGSKSFGRLEPDTGAYTALFTLSHTQGFVQCEGEALAEGCESQLCADWCAPLHLAEAPLCEAYDQPQCGPDADLAYYPEGKEIPELDHVVDPLCPHPDDDTTTPPVDAGSAPMGQPDGGSTGETDAAVGPTADGSDLTAGDSGSSGCSTSPAGRTPLAAVMGLVAVALLIARRRLVRGSKG